MIVPACSIAVPTWALSEPVPTARACMSSPTAAESQLRLLPTRMTNPSGVVVSSLPRGVSRTLFAPGPNTANIPRAQSRDQVLPTAAKAASASQARQVVSELDVVDVITLLGCEAGVPGSIPLGIVKGSLGVLGELIAFDVHELNAARGRRPVGAGVRCRHTRVGEGVDDQRDRGVLRLGASERSRRHRACSRSGR